MAYPIGYRCRWKSPVKPDKTGVIVDTFNQVGSGIIGASLKYVLYDEQTHALDVADWFDIVMLDPPPATLKGSDQ